MTQQMRSIKLAQAVALETARMKVINWLTRTLSIYSEQREPEKDTCMVMEIMR
jgi:hypothetical protein